MGRVGATPVDTTFARRACSACDAGPGMAVTTLRLRAMDATAAVVTSVEVCIVSVIIVSAYRRGPACWIVYNPDTLRALQQRRVPACWIVSSAATTAPGSTRRVPACWIVWL